MAVLYRPFFRMYLGNFLLLGGYHIVTAAISLAAQAITRSSPTRVDHRSGICLDLHESVHLRLHLQQLSARRRWLSDNQAPA
jgi:hypothetical protein